MVRGSHGVPARVFPTVILVSREVLDRRLLFIRLPQPTSMLSNLVLHIGQTVDMSVIIFQFHVVRDIRDHSFRVLTIVMLVINLRPVN